MMLVMATQSQWKHHMMANTIQYLHIQAILLFQSILLCIPAFQTARVRQAYALAQLVPMSAEDYALEQRCAVFLTGNAHHGRLVQLIAHRQGHAPIQIAAITSQASRLKPNLAQAVTASPLSP